MKIEKGIISSSELMFLIIGLIESSTLTSAFISQLTKQNTWIALLIGLAIALLLLLVYTSLSKKMPDKNLIEMNDLIYGCHLGKVMSILYIYFFWFIVAASLRLMGDFFSTYLFSETCISIFIIAMTIVCIYTLKKGLEVIARSSVIIAILVVVICSTSTIFTLQYVNLSNFLPIFQIKLINFIEGVNIMVSIPLGEIVVFLMFFPYVNDKKRIRKSAFSGLIIGGILFFILILRNTSVLGSIEPMHGVPSYQLVKLINVGEIITRLDILVAIVFLFNMFLKICIFYYATVLSAAQFFKLRSYKPLVIPVGIISSVFAVSMYNSAADEAYQAGTYSVYAIVFVILFPIISLIIASIRKL